MENHIVFVYGTLLTGEHNHRVAKPYIVNVKPGRVIGRLFNTGGYPALVPDPDGYPIEGEWLTVTSEGLRNMDRLEGYRGPGERNFYDRVNISDIEHPITGWIYIWHDSKGLPEITTGSWRSRKKIV